ncbi:MAG: ion transporter, partial [Rhodoglobus sp.]
MTQSRWNQLMDIPLTTAAAIFLVAYAWEVIADLSGQALLVAEIIIAATWLVFVVDYVMNLVHAQNRWHWFTRHLFDLLVV